MSKPYQVPESKRLSDLWTRQAGLCALCDKPMLRNRFEAPHGKVWAKQRATLDHIVPVSKGGRDDLDNLQLAHARCNKIKGNAL